MTEPSTPVEILVGEKLDAEIDRVKADLKQADEDTFELQGAVDLLRTGDPDGWTADQRDTVESMERRLQRTIERGVALSEKLQVLRSPEELERRVNDAISNQASLRRLHMSEETTTKPKKVMPADQGVPAEYLGDNGNFRIGMDARLKSDLVGSITGEVTAEKPGQSLHIFTEAEAIKILEARGWTHFLERKRAMLAEKAAAKEKAQADREVRAREQAEAKAAKDAEKAAAKATEGSKASSGKATGAPSKAEQTRQQREAQAAAAGQ